MLSHLFLSLVLLIQSLFTTAVPKEGDVVTEFSPRTTLRAQVTQVIDGDTIDVQIGMSTSVTRVRYIGINTPEPYPKNKTSPECGSHEATVANQALVASQTVTLITDADPIDPYGRLLAYVYVGEMFVNEELVRMGYATTMSIKPNTRYRQLFTQLRDEAKTSDAGNWRLCPSWD